MPTLHIIFDESDRVCAAIPPQFLAGPVWHSALTLPKGIGNRDIYEIARKLGGLLLEQLECNDSSAG